MTIQAFLLLLMRKRGAVHVVSRINACFSCFVSWRALLEDPLVDMKEVIMLYYVSLQASAIM